jgi:hypothetical protein
LCTPVPRKRIILNKYPLKRDVILPISKKSIFKESWVGGGRGICKNSSFGSARFKPKTGYTDNSGDVKITV